MFSNGNRSSQHNLHFNIYHINSALLIYSTVSVHRRVLYYTESKQKKQKNKKQGRPGNEARLDLQFHMKAFEFTMNKKFVYFHALQTMHFPHGLPSHLSFLTKKKPTETSHNKVFGLKTSACRYETLKKQPNWMGMIPQ